jgi:hypothetical protein
VLDALPITYQGDGQMSSWLEGKQGGEWFMMAGEHTTEELASRLVDACAVGEFTFYDKEGKYSNLLPESRMASLFLLMKDGVEVEALFTLEQLLVLFTGLGRLITEMEENI